MKAARIVYLIIFLMACLPIAYFGLRNLGKRDGRRVLRIAVTVADIAAAGIVCFGLWRYTIDSQPALIAERFADSLVAALDEDSAEGHVNRITDAGLAVPDGEWIARSRTALDELEAAGWLADEPALLSKKSVEESAGKTWYMMPAQGDIAIAITLAETDGRWMAVGTGVITGDDAREIRDKMGFSDVG